jgi:hypothetical protein
MSNLVAMAYTRIHICSDKRHDKAQRLNNVILVSENDRDSDGKDTRSKGAMTVDAAIASKPDHKRSVQPTLVRPYRRELCRVY